MGARFNDSVLALEPEDTSKAAALVVKVFVRIGKADPVAAKVREIYTSLTTPFHER